MLSGGNRNTVLEVRYGAQLLVARRSLRSPASMDWEIALLDHLARNGLRVPAVVPTLDGRRQIDGILVQTWMDGRATSSATGVPSLLYSAECMRSRQDAAAALLASTLRAAIRRLWRGCGPVAHAR